MYKLLIVDDNFIQIQSLMHFIRWDEYGITEIKTARDGNEGIDVFKDFIPDIIIADVMMPILNGIDMAREIRNMGSDTKIVFISCYEDFSYLQGAMDCGATAYILKPFSQKEIAECVEKIIAKIEEERKYTRVFLDELDIMRENFLYKMLYSDYFNIDYINKSIKELHFERYKNYIASKFIIEGQNKSYIKVNNIIQMIKSYLFKDVKCIIVAQSETDIAILFMSEEPDCDKFSQDLCKNIEQLVGILEKENNIKLKSGFSKPFSSLFDVHIMLKKVSDSFLEESDRQNDSTQTMAFLDYNIQELSSKLNIIINKNKKSEVANFANLYCPADLMTDKNNLKSLYATIIGAIQLLLINYNMKIEDVFGRTDIMWHKTDRFSNAGEFNRWLYNIINALIDFLGGDEKNKNEKTVADIVEYINENYRYITNVEQIASKLYISSSYARSLFKKYIGKTIFDYLISVRMDEAKRLLSNPDSKVYEVAELVGYKSKQHFVATFKQCEGMLPSEFQSMKRKDNKK